MHDAFNGHTAVLNLDPYVKDKVLRQINTTTFDNDIKNIPNRLRENLILAWRA